MRKRLLNGLIVLLFCGSTVSCSRPGPSTADRPPNIVLIMADDMGYSDIGAFGGEIQTPNLDRLAENGLRFTEFHNSPRCMPTRASLLTGQYPHRAGLGHMSADFGAIGYTGDLNTETVTMAEVLKTAGYKTYMSGKWHVTKHIGPWTAEPDRMSKDNWPIQRGFDRFYGTILGAGSFFDPNTLTNDSDPAPPVPPGFYYTDAINDSAATFIRQHGEDTPFFLYVAHTAPHWPLHALEEDIAKYEGSYDGGWDALRQERYHRLIEMGLLDASWPLSEREEQVPSWQALSDEEQAWYARAMEVYAAQVDRMDQGIGRVLEARDQTGQIDNTLIVFLSDNGACAEVLTDAWQGPYLKRQTRAGRKITLGNTDHRVLPGPEETFMSYGRGWANASNTPFKLFKHYTHEGGISSPFIVHWPEGLTQRGSMTPQRSQLIDLMATFVDVSGAAYPETFNGQAIAPMPGKSLVPVFQGGALEDRPLFFEHEGNRAVYRGDWKLVARHDQPWSLYQIREDRTEMNDVAADHPDIVAALLERYEAWATENYVLPWPARESAQTQAAR